MEITVGMKGEAFTDVEREDTAAEVGSGSLLVYATPCMVALMEGAACEAIAEALSEDQIACPKKGVMSPGSSCRAFKYDPLKRVPPRPTKPAGVGLSDEDFSL